MIGGVLSRARGVFSKRSLFTGTSITHPSTISQISSRVPNRELIPSEHPWCYNFYRFRHKCPRYPICRMDFESIDAFNKHVAYELCVPPGERKNAKKKAQTILTTLTPQQSKAALKEEKARWEMLFTTVRRQQSPVFVPNPQGLRGAAISDGKLYIFGAIDMGNYVDHLEVLELKCFTWSRIHFWMDPSSEPSDDVLRPLYGSSLITWGNSVLVVAGFTEDDPSPVVTVKQIDRETDAFSKVVTNGQPPVSRQGQSVTVVGTKMLLFGGRNASGSLLNDLHMLDMDTMIWTPITAAGVPPYARFNHDAACYADRYLFIYGGASSVRLFYDLHVLDLDMMEWSSEQSSPLQHPLEPAVRVDDNWYLVSGEDTAVFHFPSRVWSFGQ